MKIVLLVIGKTDTSYFTQAIDEYTKRLLHYISFNIQIIPDIKNSKNMTIDQQKQKEAELILNALQTGDYVVLLDDKGKEYTSMQFADYIEKKMLNVPKRLVFIIGGPYGFSQAVYEQAMERLTLSRMTFSHQMVRLVFVEQLYRAMTILRNEPYHHE